MSTQTRFFILLTGCLLSTVAQAADDSSIVGIWRGHSICVQKNTACHDEDAVYRISVIPGKQGHVYVSGGKVVDGKEVVMGSGEWRFDANASTLSFELPLGDIALVVNGDKMQGTFALHDKTVLRHITLKRIQH
jgi:hypothetical protein